VLAVQSGTLGRSEAYDRYMLSEEELSRWEEAFDHDGIAEITFGYQLSCRSETKPAIYKLVVLEDGVQYTLRGETRVQSAGVLADSGGRFEPEPAAAQWPPGFLAHAKQLWQRTADDLEMPPRR